MPTNRVLRVDFHVHSHFSADSDMTPEDIVKSAKKAGLDAIAVTDHNLIEGGLEVQKIAKDLIVFAGSEIKTKEGEIIGLNLKKNVPPNLTLIQTCKLLKEQNGFIIIPHPFDKFRSGIGNEIEKIIDYVDAVEVFNARTLFDGFNKLSLDIAKKNGLPCVAGSDAHFNSEIGSACTLVNCGKKEVDILRSVAAGRTKITGRKTGIMPHWKTFVRNVERKL